MAQGPSRSGRSGAGSDSGAPDAVTDGPWAFVIVGPNGAGKSTLYEHVIKPATGLPFVNADVIAAELWPGEEAVRAYDAAALATQRRDDLLAEGTSFVTETVCSHPSKVDFVRTALAGGHSVSLQVIVVPEELAVVRVPMRVESGGHDVPEDTIRTRWRRMWPVVVEAAELATETTFYDNTSADRPFQVIARLRHGRVVDEPRWPPWAPDPLKDRWPGR